MKYILIILFLVSFVSNVFAEKNIFYCLKKNHSRVVFPSEERNFMEWGGPEEKIIFEHRNDFKDVEGKPFDAIIFTQDYGLNLRENFKNNDGIMHYYFFRDHLNYDSLDHVYTDRYNVSINVNFLKGKMVVINREDTQFLFIAFYSCSKF